jgi:hypothetical protein
LHQISANPAPLMRSAARAEVDIPKINAETKEASHLHLVKTSLHCRREKYIYRARRQTQIDLDQNSLDFSP